MGIFKFGKRKEFVDLTKFRKQESVEKKEPSQDNLDFLGNLASASSDSQSDFNVSEPDERKRKLVKRFMEMTNRLEDLNNQLYHLQQRIELLERKAGLKSLE